MQFKFDAATGMLTPNDPPVVNTKAALARATSRSIQMASGVNPMTETTATIGTYAIDKNRGTLTEIAFVDTGDYNGKDFAAASDIHITPDILKFHYGVDAPRAHCTAIRSTPIRAR